MYLRNTTVTDIMLKQIYKYLSLSLNYDCNKKKVHARLFFTADFH